MNSAASEAQAALATLHSYVRHRLSSAAELKWFSFCACQTQRINKFSEKPIKWDNLHRPERRPEHQPDGIMVIQKESKHPEL